MTKQGTVLTGFSLGLEEIFFCLVLITVLGIVTTVINLWLGAACSLCSRLVYFFKFF